MAFTSRYTKHINADSLEQPCGVRRTQFIIPIREQLPTFGKKALLYKAASIIHNVDTA